MVRACCAYLQHFGEGGMLIFLLFLQCYSLPSGHMTFIQRRINVDGHMPFIQFRNMKIG